MEYKGFLTVHSMFGHWRVKIDILYDGYSLPLQTHVKEPVGRLVIMFRLLLYKNDSWITNAISV